jgi:hypothetical protein
VGGQDCEDSEALEAWWNARGHLAWRVRVDSYQGTAPCVAFYIGTSQESRCMDRSQLLGCYTRYDL